MFSYLINYFQTYCVDKQVADSACTATAYFTIGASAKVEPTDCRGATLVENQFSAGLKMLEWQLALLRQLVSLMPAQRVLMPIPLIVTTKVMQTLKELATMIHHTTIWTVMDLSPHLKK